MFKSYLTAALRNVRRYKGYAFINIFGLAVGLAACLLIALYVRFELSYDKMHEKADRIMRVQMHLANNQPGQQDWKSAMLAVGPDLKETIPQIEQFVRVSGGTQSVVEVGDQRTYEDNVFQADETLFDVFDFKVTSGSAEGMAQPNTIMLSESMAAKYFPDVDPIGETVYIGEQFSSTTDAFEVVGVFEDMPPNVHFRAEMLTSMATRASSGRLWRALAYTYIVLSPGASATSIEPALAGYGKDVLEANFTTGASLVLKPLTEIHLRSGPGSDIRPQGDIRYVWIFSAIAALILLIACINYMNLATARSAKRSREVGVRKVVGAKRGQLIWQFLSESILFASVALVLAVAMAQMMLPAFGAVMDRELEFGTGEVGIYGLLLASAILVGLISGTYPAVLLSRLKPSSILSGVGGTRAKGGLRKSLVVIQFAISMSLIVGTVVIDRQLEFVRETKLGFRKEQMMTLATRGHLEGQSGAFRQELNRVAGAEMVSMSSSVPGTSGWITSMSPDEIEEYEGDHMRFDLIWVDQEFVQTLELEIVEGRAFDSDFASDLETAVLINETAARQLGWEEPIGKKFGESESRLEVVGVFRDFHNQSMKFEIVPTMIRLGDDELEYATLRLSTGNLPATIEQVQAVWNEFVPGLPFQYSFLDDEFDAMYRSEQRLASLFGSFATVAIFIAVLGLFGLAAYTAQQRTKEIGIRKVLGASVSGLVVMLSKEFVRLVLVAFVVAAPLAYYAMENWLSSFAYRIDIGPGIFLLSGALALVVALGTVSWQAIRAATADPVKSLRYE